MKTFQKILIFFGIIFAFFVQTFFSGLNLENLTFNLFLILVIYIDYLAGVAWAILLAFCFGLLTDLFFPTPFGFNTISFFIVALSVNFIKDNILARKSISSLTINSLISISVYLIFSIFISFFFLSRANYPPANTLAIFVAKTLIINTLAILVFHLFFTYFKKQFQTTQ